MAERTEIDSPSQFLETLKDSAAPVEISINGEATITISDPISFRRLLRFAEEIEGLEARRATIAERRAGLGLTN